MQQVRKFALNVGWVLLSSIIVMLIGLLLSIVLARWLGAANLGLYRMVITIQGIAMLVATFGIPSAVIKYVAEYKDDKEKLSQTITSGFISSVIFGVVAGILLYALSGILAGVFHMPELAHLLKMLAFVCPFSSLLAASLGLLNGLREMKSYASLTILRSLLLILFIVAFVRLGFGVKGAVFGIMLSAIGGCIFGLYLSRKSVYLSLKGFIQNVRKLVSFGSQIVAANAMGTIMAQIDIILIGYFLAAKDVGYYSIAVSLSSFFLLVPQAIGTITYPATSEYWSKNSHQALQKMIDKSMKYSACILLPLGLGVGFFSKELVTTIFGSEFIYAVLPLGVLLIARVISGSTELPIGASLSGVGRPDLPLKIVAISAGTNIGLNILLIPLYGILGAAIATAISLLLATAISLVFIVRTLAVKIDVKWYVRAMGSACAAVVLFLVGSRLVCPYIVGGVILCAYTVVDFRLFLTRDDKTLFKSLAKSMLHPKRPV